MTKKKWKKIHATSIKIPCYYCNESGYLFNKVCSKCDGSGSVFVDPDDDNDNFNFSLNNDEQK